MFVLHPMPTLTFPELVAPIAVALAFIAACSRLKEPNRRNFSAIMIAGAGAAYLNGGLGAWEFPFCALVTYLAYRGLKDYRFLGAAWVLHAMWDAVHFAYGNPIVPFAPTSSAGCAICDVVLALWYFRGAPPLGAWFSKTATYGNADALLRRHSRTEFRVELVAPDAPSG